MKIVGGEGVPMKRLKDCILPGVTEAEAIKAVQDTVCMEMGYFHTEKSILSEHYGFSDALLEEMQDSNNDCFEHVDPSEWKSSKAFDYSTGLSLE